MTKHDGFDAVSWQAFQEAALDKYDFTTCQRSDGSYYGTGGTCRKGSEVKGGKPEDKKKKAKSTNSAGMTLRDAQKKGLTTGGSKQPDWNNKRQKDAVRAGKNVKKTSNKDRAKD